MTGDNAEAGLTFIDAYAVDDIAKAPRIMVWCEKARMVVRALATAPNPAMSRLEMTKTIGSDSVNAINSVLGHFATASALRLDPELEAQWKPADGRSSDWVLFACSEAHRLDESSEGEQDNWVFVIDETLARALARIGFAPYLEISDGALAEWAAVDEEAEDDSETDEDEVLASRPREDIWAAEKSGELDDLDPTERDAVLSARMGQGSFRGELLACWDGRRAVTGPSITEAIVASHIKPWALCDDSEPLDSANGLPLIGTQDRLFGYGLISFDAAGMIILSLRIPQEESPLLNLNPAIRVRDLRPETAANLAFHRANCFWESAESDYEDAVS